MTIPAPPARPPRSRWWRHYWGIIASGVLFLAAVAAIASFIVTDLGFRPWLEPSPTNSTLAPSVNDTRAPNGLGVSPPEVEGTKAGACLDEAGTEMSCDRPHFSELIAASGPCDLPALVTYAGGVLTRDVLRGDLIPSETSNGCTVVLPAGLSSKIQNGLLRSDHAALRQCWDRFSERNVSCDQAHTAEAVYFDSDPGAAPTSCVLHADSYTNGAYTRNQGQLEALVLTSGSSVSCLVQARGSNELSGSLRNLGTGALPLHARP
ncbi:hypothetical protein QF038_000914 [Pseudarthrobacter sp. W1I19]|nr:hypothetical protein [Pseudarthrobacter sp. W1I19]